MRRDARESLSRVGPTILSRNDHSIFLAENNRCELLDFAPMQVSSLMGNTDDSRQASLRMFAPSLENLDKRSCENVSFFTTLHVELEKYPQGTCIIHFILLVTFSCVLFLAKNQYLTYICTLVVHLFIFVLSSQTIHHVTLLRRFYQTIH